MGGLGDSVRSPLTDVVVPSIVVAETNVLLDVDALRGDEVDAVATATQRRRREFSTGRACARAALASLGFEGAAQCPIGTGERREPRFPDPVVGSIAHAEAAVVAAVAWRRDVLSLGVDVEVRRELTPDQVATVTLPDELIEDGSRRHAHRPVALFAAREACFKLWSPVTREWLGFHDVRVHLDERGARFRVSFLGEFAALARRHGLTDLVGGIGWSERHVYAAAWIDGAS